MDVKIEQSWKDLLQEEFAKPYFSQLADFVKNEYRKGTVYPPGKYIFNALNQVPFAKVKVVILGQDPYHGPNQAHGLSFSVPSGTKAPPSLQNIFKEISTDLGQLKSTATDLSRWASQGVLLLNSTLTVRAGLAGSHQNRGWETFTDAVIKAISEKKEHVVFVLWGNYAIRKGHAINQDKHLVIKSAHPSPLSAHHGFFGSRPFSQTNVYLSRHGLAPIDW